MVTNILIEMFKTDISQKQSDFDPKYSSKDNSGSFMKIFESANKSYNFNNDKMDSFPGSNNNENYLKNLSFDNENSFKPQEESLNYNHESTSGNLYNEKHYEKPQDKSYDRENNNVNSDKKYEKSDKNWVNSDKKEAQKYKNNDISSQEKTATSSQNSAETSQANGNKQTEETKQKTDANKTSDDNEKAAVATTSGAVDQKKAEKPIAENAKPEKQPQQQSQQATKSEPAKDTAGKLLLENAKTGEKEAKVAEKEVKNIVNPEKEADSAKKKAVTTTNTENTQEKSKEARLQKNVQKLMEQAAEKSSTEKKNTAEIPNNTEIKEKKNSEKPEIQELANNKSKNDRSEARDRIPLPPNARQIEAKEDLKIENIKIVANAETQKTAGEAMNKQGQQNFGQESRPNLNQVVAGENSSQKVDVQRAAQFEKVLNSKQAESTQKSVINQVKNASAQLGNGRSEVSIALRPDNLGRVNINLVSHKGELTAQITAENNQVKEMMTKGLESLKQGLSEQGINVNRVVINVQDSSSERETDFDGANKFDENGNSPEADSDSENGEGLEENGQNPAEMESYDFEEESGESDKPKVQNLVGNVDYKV